MNKAITFLSENPTKEFTAAQISEAVGIKPVHVSQMMSQALSQGYIIHRRVRRDKGCPNHLTHYRFGGKLPDKSVPVVAAAIELKGSKGITGAPWLYPWT